MKLLVSACLLGENCKYNGGNNDCAELKEILRRPAPDGTTWEVITVCPECLGGLPTPRKPAEIVRGTVQTEDGQNVDGNFHIGAKKAYEIALRCGADTAVLKANSPSCGSNGIYDGTFSHRVIPGQGVFAELLIKNGFTVVTEKELSKLF